jgi:NAD(P)-dependent dehydrogenase (short-subunit alcohol dehydrogenase family)
MDLHLNAKTALVTGSTAGIGLEIARKLAVEGTNVIITGRNKAKLDQAVGSIRASGGAGVSGVGNLLRHGRLERREKDAAEQDSADLQFPHGALRLRYRLNAGLSSRLPQKAGGRGPISTLRIQFSKGTVQPWPAPIVSQ